MRSTVSDGAGTGDAVLQINAMLVARSPRSGLRPRNRQHRRLDDRATSRLIRPGVRRRFTRQSPLAKGAEYEKTDVSYAGVRSLHTLDLSDTRHWEPGQYESCCRPRKARQEAHEPHKDGDWLFAKRG